MKSKTLSQETLNKINKYIEDFDTHNIECRKNGYNFYSTNGWAGEARDLLTKIKEELNV